MTPAGVIATVVLVSGMTVAAQDRSSTVADPRVDFKTIKTFTMGKAVINGARPELDNRLFEKKLAGAIRQALVAEGFAEVQTGADVVVTFSVKSLEITSSARGFIRGQGPRPVRETEGVLEIVLTRSGDGPDGVIWKGVYGDRENTGSTLVEKLPADARRLIAKIR